MRERTWGCIAHSILKLVLILIYQAQPHTLIAVNLAKYDLKLLSRMTSTEPHATYSKVQENNITPKRVNINNAIQCTFQKKIFLKLYMRRLQQFYQLIPPKIVSLCLCLTLPKPTNSPMYHQDILKLGNEKTTRQINGQK